jgi:hypothetical protein
MGHSIGGSHTSQMSMASPAHAELQAELQQAALREQT